MDRSARWAVWIVVGLGALHALLFLGLVVDDAYISFRYARQWAAGDGLGYNPGQTVEGYTNFSMVVLAAGGFLVGLRPELLVPPLGIGCGAVLVVLVVRAARRMADQEGVGTPWAGVVAGLIVAGTVGVAMYAVSGLETVPYAVVLFAAGDALIRRRSVAFALLTSLAFFTRPDAALLGVAGVALLVIERRWRDATIAISVFVAMIAPYLAWKWWYFGALVPNTLHAKRPELSEGLNYLVQWLMPPTSAQLPRQQGGAGLLILALIGAVRGGRQRRLALAAWAMYAVAAVFQGGDWMLAHRFFVPVVGWLSVAADRPLLRVFRRSGKVRGRRSVAVMAAAALALYLGSQLVQGHGVRSFYAQHAGYEQRVADLARSLTAEGKRHAALFNIGLFGYVAADMEIVDLGGLTDSVIGRAPGGHGRKHPAPAYLSERDPDVVVVFSYEPAVLSPAGALRLRPKFEVESYLLHSEWLRDGYQYSYAVELSAHNYAHVFERR